MDKLLVSKFVELGKKTLKDLQQPRRRAWWVDVRELLYELDAVRRSLQLPHWLKEFDANHEAIVPRLHDYKWFNDYRAKLDQRWKPGRPFDPDCLCISFRPHIPWSVVQTEGDVVQPDLVVCKVPVALNASVCHSELQRYGGEFPMGEPGTSLLEFVFSDPYQSRDQGRSFSIVRVPVDLLLRDAKPITDVLSLEEAVRTVEAQRTLGQWNDVYLNELRHDAMHSVGDWVHYVEDRWRQYVAGDSSASQERQFHPKHVASTLAVEMKVTAKTVREWARSAKTTPSDDHYIINVLKYAAECARSSEDRSRATELLKVYERAHFGTFDAH